MSDATIEKFPAARALDQHLTTPVDSPADHSPNQQQAERKLLRKLDWRIIPILWFLFLVSFFDRSNIG